MATRLTSNQKILGSTPSVSAIFLFFIRDSLMVRMGACRVPDRGSIPRRGDLFLHLRGSTIVGVLKFQQLPCFFYLFIAAAPKFRCARLSFFSLFNHQLNKCPGNYLTRLPFRRTRRLAPPPPTDKCRASSFVFLNLQSNNLLKKT